MSTLPMLIVPPFDQGPWLIGPVLVLLTIALIGVLLIRNIAAVRFKKLRLKATTPAVLSLTLILALIAARMVLGAW